MNEIKYAYGYHTPQMSTEIVEALYCLYGSYLEIVDTSYKNDECDSIRLQDKDSNPLLDIYLPNCVIQDDRLNDNYNYTHYCIKTIYSEDYVEVEGNSQLTFKDLTNYIDNTMLIKQEKEQVYNEVKDYMYALLRSDKVSTSQMLRLTKEKITNLIISDF
jgi:hypothetical protein